MYVIVNRDMALSAVTVVSWHGQPTEFTVHTARVLLLQGNRMWSEHTTKTLTI